MNKQDEWYTPYDIMDKVKAVLGNIDVDPASNEVAQSYIEASTFYTVENSGLVQPWKGQVWCNPPYSISLLRKFTTKFKEEAYNGNMKEGIILTNSGTDTLWNQNLAPFIQVYTIGRIPFLNSDLEVKATGGRGQCFTYFGDNPHHFIETFGRDNFCWVPNYALD